MSTNRKRGKTSHDDYDDPVASQSLTQAEKAVANLSKDDKNRKVADLVLYLLVADQKKIPIKRIDICKNVLKEHQKAFGIFMEEAKQRLRDIFGISLEEVVDAKQKSYVLITEIEHDSDNPHVMWPQEDNAKMALLMIALSLIFMNGNVMVDHLLYHTLKKLGVEIELHHEQFGDTKRVLTGEFVRQGYLEHTRQPNSEPPVYEYTWGPRAKLETSKRMVLNFVCQIYGSSDGEMDPKMWTSQWQDVLRSEKEVNEED